MCRIMVWDTYTFRVIRGEDNLPSMQQAAGWNIHNIVKAMFSFKMLHMFVCRSW